MRVTTDYAYDSYGNVASVSVTPIEKPVRISSQDWTADGRFPASSTNPEGHVTRTTWDPVLARPDSVVDANGLATLSLYDDFGRETRSTRPDGTGTSIARLPCGTDCPSSDARFVVGVTRRGVGDVPLGYAETGYDLYGRAVYSRDDQPSPKSKLVESFGGRYVSSANHSVDELRQMVGNIDVVYEATGASSISFEMMKALGTNGIFVFTGVPGRKMPIQVDTDLLMRNIVLNNQVPDSGV